MAHLTNEDLYEVLQIEMTNHSDRTFGQWLRYRELQNKAEGWDPDRLLTELQTHSTEIIV